MRAFVALQAGDWFEFGPGAPPADADDPLSRLSVEALENSLKGAGGKLRFVKPDARHLTLKFLGDIEPSAAKEISAALVRAVKGTQPFPAGARGVGFFPNARRPKVVWVGIDDPEKRIAGLHDAVDRELEALGHERHQGPFVPHITVARVAEIPPGEGLARAVDPLVDTRFGWARAAGIEFIESTLKPGGPVYRAISKHPFAPL